MDEIWKDIPGYEGNYQASSEGRIRSLDRPKFKGRILKHDKKLSSKDRKRAYYTICLSVNGITKYEYVHRCIAKAFIENPENKSDVNHIDGNRLNNKLTNLEWVTKSENTRHMYYVLGTGIEGQKIRGPKISAIMKAKSKAKKLLACNGTEECQKQ